MAKYRFTLRYLLGVTAALCISCAALRYPTQWCAVSAISVAVAGLVVAIVGVATGRGTIRAFCWGFAIVGWSHLMLAFTKWFGSLLFSRYCLDQLAYALGYLVVPSQEIDEQSLTSAMMNFVPGSPPDSYYKYLIIGQSLLTLYFAAIGGVIGRYFHLRTPEPPGRPSS